jgi:hypothetical protein
MPKVEFQGLTSSRANEVHEATSSTLIGKGAALSGHLEAPLECD